MSSKEGRVYIVLTIPAVSRVYDLFDSKGFLEKQRFRYENIKKRNLNP